MTDDRGTQPATASAIGMAIGRRVRAARTDLGWTLDQLAQRAGLSRRLLVNVEQGNTNPTIGTLLRLSDALGIGLPALVETSDDPGALVTVRRAADQTPVWTSSYGGSATMVGGTAPPDVCELWDWRLAPGDAHTSEAHRAGTRELLLVLAGTVDLQVGDTEHRLKTGDSATFDGTAPHAYRNASATRPARFTLAVFEPNLSKEHG